MTFCFLKIITSIQRIKPGVEEEFCPISLPKNEAPLTQAFTILRENEIYLVTFQVRKGLDHTIWGNDRDVPVHQLLKPFRCHELAVKIDFRFHNQSMWRKRQEVFGMWICGHGVAERWHECPAAWRPIDVVLASNREKSCVAYKESEQQSKHFSPARSTFPPPPSPYPSPCFNCGNNGIL